jgi:flavin reductase (DIM6/NTAB) family NADH-FMN oxidoreductase RutF
MSRSLSIDGQTLRQVMGRFATGVTVVTTRSGEQPFGMTANAVCSVSLDPPLVLVCVAHKARTHALIRDTRAFTLSILAHDQQPMAERFARPADPSQFEGVALQDPGVPTAGPVLDGALGYLDCRLVAAHEAGDHTIYVAEVQAAAVLAEAGPVLFYRGRYRKIAGEIA